MARYGPHHYYRSPPRSRASRTRPPGGTSRRADGKKRAGGWHARFMGRAEQPRCCRAFIDRRLMRQVTPRAAPRVSVAPSIISDASGHTARRAARGAPRATVRHGARVAARPVGRRRRRQGTFHAERGDARPSAMGAVSLCRRVVVLSYRRAVASSVSSSHRVVVSSCRRVIVPLCRPCRRVIESSSHRAIVSSCRRVVRVARRLVRAGKGHRAPRAHTAPSSGRKDGGGGDASHREGRRRESAVVLPFEQPAEDPVERVAGRAHDVRPERRERAREPLGLHRRVAHCV